MISFAGDALICVFSKETKIARKTKTSPVTSSKPVSRREGNIPVSGKKSGLAVGVGHDGLYGSGIVLDLEKTKRKASLQVTFSHLSSPFLLYSYLVCPLPCPLRIHHFTTYERFIDVINHHVTFFYDPPPPFPPFLPLPFTPTPSPNLFTPTRHSRKKVKRWRVH